MDFAKAELKAAKDPQLMEMKNKIYNQAVVAFEEKLKQVLTSSRFQHNKRLVELTWGNQVIQLFNYLRAH